MEQLQSILTDLDNKAITKHQAYDLILVLFDVSKAKHTFCKCIQPMFNGGFSNGKYHCVNCGLPVAK